MRQCGTVVHEAFVFGSALLNTGVCARVYLEMQVVLDKVDAGDGAEVGALWTGKASLGGIWLFFVCVCVCVCLCFAKSWMTYMYTQSRRLFLCESMRVWIECVLQVACLKRFYSEACFVQVIQSEFTAVRK